MYFEFLFQSLFHHEKNIKAANAIAIVIILWDKAKAAEFILHVYKESCAKYVSSEQGS